MKNKFMGCLLSIALCLTSVPALSAAAATTLTENKTGTEDGYDYELWKDSGNTSMTLNGGGAFSCQWSNINNSLFRKGKKFNPLQSYQSVGNISIDFGCDYQPNGNSYLCVYGWTKSPLVEYYIVESWGTWRPPGATSKGQITVDGGTYDVYQTTRVNQPSIEGDRTTFDQYWSVRTTKRDSGVITVTDHFKAWEKMGMKMGNLYEVALNVEGYQSSGKANVYKNDIYIGDSPDPTEPTEPTEPPKPIDPDKDGYYFHATYESDEEDWAQRGSDSVAQSKAEAYDGSGSLFVSDRTEAWNGAGYTLNTKAFVPGYAYSFSTMVMQNTSAAEDLCLTLQYDDASGETQYDQIAKGTAKKGEWTQLANTSYMIPAGASNMLLYVETPENLIDFYVDEAIGAVDGKVIPLKNVDPTYDPGDVDHSGQIDAKDVTALQSYLVRKTTTINQDTADVNGDGKISALDLSGLKSIILGQSEVVPSPVTTTTALNQYQSNPTEYMASVQQSLLETEPSSVTAQNAATGYGTVEAISYFSSTASKNKGANVLLPAGYSKNESYPVLYVLHGIFGDQNTMLDESMKIQTIIGNLTASGEAEKMIVVFPSMFTSKTMSTAAGFDQATAAAYDNFLNDLTVDLMPYMEQNYSIKTGRDNTAITGFSMGGREALYIGISHPELFGYIGGCCPAPGIVATTDQYMTHAGVMTESEMKISNAADKPYLFLITAAQNDSVVGNYPESYHSILTKNSELHLWQIIAAGDHGGNSVRPHIYNFAKSIFKAN